MSGNRDEGHRPAINDRSGENRRAAKFSALRVRRFSASEVAAWAKGGCVRSPVLRIDGRDRPVIE